MTQAAFQGIESIHLTTKVVFRELIRWNSWLKRKNTILNHLKIQPQVTPCFTQFTLKEIILTLFVLNWCFQNQINLNGGLLYKKSSIHDCLKKNQFNSLLESKTQVPFPGINSVHVITQSNGFWICPLESSPQWGGSCRTCGPCWSRTPSRQCSCSAETLSEHDLNK